MQTSLLKCLLFGASLAFATFSAGGAFAQEESTAYHAMKAVGKQLGRGALNHIVLVSGVNGNPQPARWRIVLAGRGSAGAAREIEVAEGRIVSDRETSGDVGGGVINTAKLNLDSSGAYAVAAHTAETSHVIFDFVNYTLRTDQRGNPIWVVALQSRAGRSLGSIHIGANKGNITRVEGMYTGRNVEQVEGEPSVDQPPPSEDADDEDENIVKRRVKQFFRRTARDASDMFHRVRRSFADFIEPERREER